MATEIINLLRLTSKDTPIVGFSNNITDEQAYLYIEELNKSLLSKKCLLVTFNAQKIGIIGVCTLKVNSNPNNAHIADLGKGMINKEYRGSGILAGAFFEICLQCERKNIEVVTLDVRSESTAYSIWTRFGFETYGTLLDYSRHEGISYSGSFMHQSVVKLKALADSVLETHLITSE
jgi:predicted GNAT family N-acyltransferase